MFVLLLKKKKNLQRITMKGKNKVADLHWIDLCNLDDLSKVLIFDQCGLFIKKYENRHIPSLRKINSELKHIAEKHTNKKNVNEKVQSLVKVCEKFKLFSVFNIRNDGWLNMYLKSYLDFFNKDSKVQLRQCNRYAAENNKGVTVIANQDIEANSKLNCIFGFYLPITKEDEAVLKSKKKDYSILLVSGLRKTNILVGSVAFLNHDCNYNSVYIANTGNSVTVNVIKNIRKGDEIFVDYGDHYFGENNKDCECDTCKQKKNDSLRDEEDFKGFITSSNGKGTAECICCNQKSDSFNMKADIRNMISENWDEVTSNTCEDDVEDDIFNFPDVILDSRLSNSFVELEDWVVETMNEDEFVDSFVSLASATVETNSGSSPLRRRVSPPPLSPPSNRKASPDGHQLQSKDRQGSTDRLSQIVALESVADNLMSFDLIQQPYSNPCPTNLSPPTTASIIQQCCASQGSPRISKPSTKKNPYCMYCKTHQTQFARHLKQHKKEKYVKMYFAANDQNKKNRILGFIRNKGYASLEKKTGKETPVKSTRKGVITIKIKCDMCEGRFSQETLKKHIKNCFGRYNKLSVNK